MQNVNEIMAEELSATGLDPDQLDDVSHYAIQGLAPALDHAITALDGKPQAMRVAAAALRSYARVCEQYAAAIEAEDGPR